MSEFDAAAYDQGLKQFQNGRSLRQAIEHILVGPDDEAKQFSFVIGFLDGALDAVRRAVAS